jgi:integrase
MPRPNRGPFIQGNDRGIYEIRWSEKGRSRRRSTGTSDFQFAQKVLANFLLHGGVEAARGEAVGPLMVRDVMGDEEVPGEDYWHEHVVPNVIDKASARYAYVKLLKHFGHLAVKDILPKHVRDYVTARKAGTIGRPSVNHTISRELSVLNAAIHHAVKEKRLDKADQPFIALPGTSPPRDRWLSEDEADALLDAALDEVDPRQPTGHLPRVFLFVALALNTASRKGALLEMTWEQIDLENGMIYLNPAGREQTNKHRPKVPISDELRPILETAEFERTTDRVFGDYLSVRTAFRNAVKRAGLEKVTPHVLRHTWATWAALGGKSMYDIAAVLGDSVQTVIRTYAHHSPEHLRGAVNNVRPSSRRAPTEERMAA